MKKLYLLPLSLLLILAGCKKETSGGLSNDQEAAASRYFMQAETDNELAFNDVFDNSFGVNTEVGLGGTGVFGRAALGLGGREYGVDSLACLTVTTLKLNPPDLFPLKVTLDFGSNCIGNDGRVRSGKVNIVYTGKLIFPGKSATATFDNFRIDSMLVQGTLVITNTTTPGSNQRQFTVTITEGKLIRPNGNYSLWSSTRVITQVEGNATPDLAADDVFSITGNAHGKLKRGNDIFLWHSEITEPLRKRFICKWITKGILKVWRESLPNSSPWIGTLNYGNGLCDNQATLTVNGVSQQITLH